MKNYPNSILNVEVSCFADYNTPSNPVPVNLITWLTSTKYKDKVEYLRAIPTKGERDKIKATLPAITPSGIFSYREEKSLVKHSGFIQFDIDTKENPHVRDWSRVKRQISRIKNVAYCGLSVSGNGLWGLIPIAHPEKHKEHFQALQEDFAEFYLHLDNKPSNVASLRGYSYDPDAYFNHEALIYYKYEPLPQTSKKANDTNSLPADLVKVEALVKKIVEAEKDITANYAKWFEISCSLQNEYTKAAREAFHKISQFHSEYSPEMADHQFNECLKHNYDYSIGTFFHYCKEAGFEIQKRDRSKSGTRNGKNDHGVTNSLAAEDSPKPPCPGPLAPIPIRGAEALEKMQEKNPEVSKFIDRLGLERDK